MEQNIKVGLVEDQKFFREGLIAILSDWDINVVFTSIDGFSVLDKLEESEQIPDVMLIDLTLPQKGTEECNGSHVLQLLKEHYPEMKNIILSAHDDPYLIAKMIEERANGYLVKDSDPDEVFQAIKDVYSKGSYINEKTLNAIQQKLQGKSKPPKGYGPLSNREVEVLKCICQQHTSFEIAEKLFISEKTVNGHRNNLLQKTGSRNVTGLVMYAVKHNLVELI